MAERWRRGDGDDGDDGDVSCFCLLVSGCLPGLERQRYKETEREDVRFMAPFLKITENIRLVDYNLTLHPSVKCSTDG